MASSGEKRILCVGLVCADIINVCHKFPKEDTDQRVADQWWHRGGNAANSSTALAQLGAQVECLATMAHAPELGFFEEDFRKYGIHIEHCVYHNNCSTPLSIVMVNKQNGSRTILHSNKNLPELTYADFQKVNLSENKYKWIHFEGRSSENSVQNVKKMVQSICAHNKTVSENDKITVSVEVEKPRAELEELLPLGDYVFISKEHAEFAGFNNKEEAVEGLKDRCQAGATVICAWGEDGAIARTGDGETYTSAIFPPDKVIDTLGAGDTFNAAVILALSRNEGVQEAVTFGCQVAGAKCGLVGYNGLKEWYESYCLSELKASTIKNNLKEATGER